MELTKNIKVKSTDIYKDLLKKIEKLEYEPGKGISESELCTEYGVTRHIVRGAITLLKQNNLVDVFPQKGTFVSLIDKKLVSEIMFVRSTLEAESVVRLIEKGNTKNLCNRMKDNLKRQMRITDFQNESEKFHMLDTQFHSYIFKEAGISSVIELISGQYIHVRRCINLTAKNNETMERLIQEHVSILNFLEECNAHKAQMLIREHLEVHDFFQSNNETERFFA